MGRNQDGEGCEGGLSQFYNDLLVLKRSEAMRQKIGSNKADVWVRRVLLGFSLDFAVLEIFN